MKYALRTARQPSTKFRNLHVRPKLPNIDIKPEVEHAIESGLPVVALESAIITHGLPHPSNSKTAFSVENRVRSTGSIPATIGILKGRIKVGMTTEEIEQLADPSTTRTKISRRDIGASVALKRNGGTTCSATLLLASLAGVRIFATGGLGGVHRGGESTMDVSADLHDLARYPVGLVSAGVKSILDIGRTLEYLETLGVPVITYGETDDFPAFYTAQSGYKSPWKVNDPKMAARILDAQWSLGLLNGALIAAPIPQKYEAAGMALQKAVEDVLLESEKLGVHKWGKNATPWLLERVSQRTGGLSITSNVALIENTAFIGGQIASEYAKLPKERTSEPAFQVNLPSPSARNEQQQPQLSQDLDPSFATRGHSSEPADLASTLVVIGAAAIDVTAQVTKGAGTPGSTDPGTVSTSPGGVARNMAEAAHRFLGFRRSPEVVHLLTPIGDDSFGSTLVNDLTRLGMATHGLFSDPSRPTAVCNLFLDSRGNLISGVADMDIIRSLDSEQVVSRLRELNPRLVALDANLSSEVLAIIVNHCWVADIPVFFEPTSVVKSTTIVPAVRALSKSGMLAPKSPIKYASPNLLELARLHNALAPVDIQDHVWWRIKDGSSLDKEFKVGINCLAQSAVSDNDPSKGSLSFLVDERIVQMALDLLPFFNNLVIKCGSQGILTVFQTSADAWKTEADNVRTIIGNPNLTKDTVIVKHYPPLVLDRNPVCDTGAGDSLVGVLLAELLRSPGLFDVPDDLNVAMGYAQRAAVLSLGSSSPISPLLSSLPMQAA